MYPLKKGLAARQAHVGLPEGTVEEEHGRSGFFGPASHLYRVHPPTGWTAIDGPLRPHLIDTTLLKPSDQTNPEGSPVEFLVNNDVRMSISRRSAPMPFTFRNADGDEVYFIHEGSGRFETDYGVIAYERGDYVIIPRGTSYRVIPDTAENYFLIVEATGEINAPSKEIKGLIGQHALYDPAVIITPELAPINNEPGDYRVRVKRAGQFTHLHYPFDPIDVVGWKGDLTPWKINVSEIRPVMSHRAHLPPSAHTTLLMDNAVMCTFLPRPLEEDTDALRVPFYHRNTDYDEVLFYHDGDFFSRDNIKPGMVTLHPIGIHHGPHPKALRNQFKKQRTDEIAVMLDARNALHLTPEAEAVEFKEYWASWQEKPEAASV
ncbi:MAG: homogentisate 1,2-dioxygenase [Bacteroidetes bacterium]|nr:homogentisate 1,2-dioxygenase [Bacteroidota bacterium]